MGKPIFLKLALSLQPESDSIILETKGLLIFSVVCVIGIYVPIQWGELTGKGGQEICSACSHSMRTSKSQYMKGGCGRLLGTALRPVLYFLTKDN